MAKTDTEETKETTDTNFVSVRGKAVKLLKCSKCDKTSYSSPGLKGHITKMHPKSKQPGEIRNKSDTKDDKIKMEADKIVDLLLNEIIEIIEINDDEECLDDITLEEVSSSMTGGNEDERKYICKCEFCAFEALSSKRYLAIQMLTKHKETCKTSKCVKCDFCVTDKNIMKRHMRDKHDVMSCSTSPPPKKKKDEVEEKEDKPAPMEAEEECFVDLSKSLEDMNIENSEEEDRVKERSRLKDEKIKEKERNNEEKELILKNKRLNAHEKQINADNRKSELVKNVNKKRKQKFKDVKMLRKEQKQKMQTMILLKLEFLILLN